MKNNTKVSFDEALDAALSRMEKGESPRDIIADFPAYAEALEETLVPAAGLLESRAEIPRVSALRAALEAAEVPVQGSGAELVSARGYFIGRSPVRIALSLGAFVVLALAFVWNGSEEKKVAVIPEDASLPAEEASGKDYANSREIAALSSPIPAPSGNANETVGALFAEMDQEYAALGSEADGEMAAAQRESSGLDEYPYAESEI